MIIYDNCNDGNDNDVNNYILHEEPEGTYIAVQGAEIAVVDNRHVNKISKHIWYTQKQGIMVYAIYPDKDTNKFIFMQNMVMMLEGHDIKPDQVVDHKNLDGLDNRVENLFISSVDDYHARHNALIAERIKELRRARV